MNRLCLTLLSLSLAGASVAQDATSQPTSQPTTAPSGDAGDALHPKVAMKTTLGTIVLELNGEQAPVTVDNFLSYAEAGFFAGTIFHRVIPNFMIQGGGYTIELDEKREGLRGGIQNEWSNGLQNLRGTIAMARLGGDPDSATAQFFINVVDNPRLSQAQPDGAGYAVFGKVVDGMEVVDAIRDTEVGNHPKLPMGAVVPTTPVVIESVEVLGEVDRAAISAQANKAAEQKKAKEAEAAMAAARQLEDYVAKMAEETGKEVQGTESGLRYVVLTEGEADAPSPAGTSTVEVHYTGWLTDGTEFDSSVKRGQPAVFPLNRVIPGWTEGVSLMKVGEKRRYLIPYELAYGAAGRPPVIPPKSHLVFDIELLSIKQ